MMTLTLSILVVVLVLAAVAYILVKATRPLHLSDESIAPAITSAPQLDQFQLNRFNQRNFNRWLKAHYKTSEKTGVRAWLSSKIGKMRQEIGATLDELKTQRKRRGGKHSLAYMEPLTDRQRRRAARLRRAAIKRSGELIRVLREEKQLVPVVMTARQRQAVTSISHTRGRLKGSESVVVGWGPDKILWRDVKASA